ncbi:MAG: Flp pilus assembly complex ATPase component TadA [Oligoflexia bacterium]|nr:Flp pilus assembly complex ATPase component TadA [Oligoflexia bacterium]
MKKLAASEFTTLLGKSDNKLLPLTSGVAAGEARPLSPALAFILQEVQREISQQSGERDKAEQLIAQVSERLGFQLSAYERDEILAFLESDEKPFGVLQSLVDDPSVSDIIVTDYSKISVQQGRRNVATSLRFPNTEVYEAFVERLLQRAGSTYSTKKPIADGMVGSFARVHAVHRSLCETGPYLTIRLNRFASVGIEDLIRVGFAPREVFEYLRAIVRSGQTVVVVGEVGTGKTTLVRAIAASIPQHDSILVIEDTPEIRLEHPHVRYMTTREANTDGAGRVSPSECIRAGMRMAMNRIIFGEIRDAEAAEAFIDVCASGHPGVSTVHARSSAEALGRLELFLGRAQRAVGRDVLSEQVATAIQVLVYVDLCRATGCRRIMEVREVSGVSDDAVRQRQIFEYQVREGMPTWKVLSKVSAFRDDIESIDDACTLSGYPSLLELTPELLMRELGKRRVA